jgi:hypothetical protein
MGSRNRESGQGPTKGCRAIIIIIIIIIIISEEAPHYLMKFMRNIL